MPLTKRANSYMYTDTGNNSVWSVGRISARYPIYGVLCRDFTGTIYYTNKNYYR
jgi:hypothetical protein